MQTRLTKWLSGTALLLGIGAMSFAALPVPTSDGSGERVEPALRSLKTPPRPRARFEPPAQLDLAAIPQGADVRDVRPVLSEVKTDDGPSTPLALTLRVDVVDQRGRPVPRATVVWYEADAAGFPEEHQLLTGTDGQVESGQLADGLYRVRVEAEGYRTSAVIGVRIPRELGKSTRIELASLRP